MGGNVFRSLRRFNYADNNFKKKSVVCLCVLLYVKCFQVKTINETCFCVQQPCYQILPDDVLTIELVPLLPNFSNSVHSFSCSNNGGKNAGERASVILGLPSGR
ncbi:hypothetical protein LSTR_LSTR014554 [Laodelphax striatellus]|uniref:Uncharacterized protein n=1 Tax=Laodelphax striatellus TaxID=195883 RepID=A0A482WJM0_LAOST|nr:hypothetical protein LSTR_LSTR014554 [Laodelphax striatellus]